MQKLTILLLVALLATALVYQLPHSERIDIGAGNEDALISGFYFAEGDAANSFRWSSELAQINFLGFGKRDAQLTLRMSGIRPAGPVQATIAVNDQPLATDVTLGGEMQEYSFPVARSQINQDGALRLTIAVPTFQSPPDTRNLGIQVDWAEVRTATGSLSLPPLLPWLSLVAGIGLLALAGFRLRLTAKVWWLWSFGWLLAVVFAQFYASAWLNAYLLWAVAAALGFWLISGWMAGATFWEWLLLAGVTVSGYRFGLRAVDFFRTGLPPGDFSIYFSAAQNLYNGQPIYDFKAASEMPNGPVYKYPPLFAIVLAPFAAFPAWNVAAGWYLLNLALYALIFVLVSNEVVQIYPQRRRVLTLLIALLFLNFQPTWESLIRGQLDVIILASAMIGLWLYRQRKAQWLGGALLAFVTMLKLYPGFLVLYLLWRRQWRAVFGFAIGFAGLTLISGLVAGWDVLWRYVIEVLSVQTAAVPYPENQSWDGFLSRFVIPAADTLWYTTIPFTPFWRWLHYACVFATLALTFLFIWQRPKAIANKRIFMLGYAASLLVMVLLWPTSWMHYQTLLLPAFALLLADQWDATTRRWWAIPLLALSYGLIAFGNEYTVLTPEINVDGLPRLLQSYKFFGMMILWLLNWQRLGDQEFGN